MEMNQLFKSIDFLLCLFRITLAPLFAPTLSHSASTNSIFFCLFNFRHYWNSFFLLLRETITLQVLKAALFSLSILKHFHIKCKLDSWVTDARQCSCLHSDTVLGLWQPVEKLCGTSLEQSHTAPSAETNDETLFLPFTRVTRINTQVCWMVWVFRSHSCALKANTVLIF